MKNLILIGIAVIFLQGCATSYQSTGFTGGYSETQLDQHIFKVSFRGNGYTSRERAADFTLLRSAEIALENGYQYFAIIDEQNYSKQGSYTTPSTTHTNGSAYVSGNYIYGNATSTTTGGQTYNITKPRSSNTIVCFTDKPENILTYSANFVSKNIREKYGITESAQ